MRTIFSYYRKYIPFMLIVLAALFGQVWCELSLPNYMSDIINNGIVAGDMDHIRTVGTIMILIAALAAACSITGSLFATLTAAAGAQTFTLPHGTAGSAILDFQYSGDGYADLSGFNRNAGSIMFIR